MGNTGEVGHGLRTAFLQNVRIFFTTHHMEVMSLLYDYLTGSFFTSGHSQCIISCIVVCRSTVY